MLLLCIEGGIYMKLEVEVEVIHYIEDWTYYVYNEDYKKSEFDSFSTRVITRDPNGMEALKHRENNSFVWYRFYDELKLTLPDGEIVYSKPRNYSPNYYLENDEAIQLQESDLTPDMALKLQDKRFKTKSF